MTKTEVIRRIGKSNWKRFMDWMQGQTLSAYPNGQTNFYDHDVEAFCKKLKTGYDRQKDGLRWD